MSDLYDSDIMEWSERQAQLLRGVAGGKPSNECPDWDNIIDEVENVGKSQLDAVESLLLNALVHDLKVALWPDARDVPHWKAEARLFRSQARRRLTPSMRRKIIISELVEDAWSGLPETMCEQPSPNVLQVTARLRSPATLDEALAEPAA